MAGFEAELVAGRDPRRMQAAELRAIGHEPLSPMAVIRAKCLDCCAGSSEEVRKCVALSCPSWPYRTGKNPMRAPPSEAQLARARSLARTRAERSEASSGRGFAKERRKPLLPMPDGPSAIETP
jgi:hypothetical protein